MLLVTHEQPQVLPEAIVNVETESKPSVAWFNPHRVPRTALAQQCIDHLLKELSQHEERQRQRKATDQSIYEAQVASLASNLIPMVLRRDTRSMAFPRSHRRLGEQSRYKPPFVTKAFKNVVDSFETAGFIHQLIGSRNPFEHVGTATLLQPSERLVELATFSGLERSDFGKALPHECVVLKDVKEDRFDKGEYVEYVDTVHTHRCRAEVNAINQWIAEADLEFDPSHAQGMLIDTADRCLRRIFTNSSFENCGRLFGGFWQELSKEQRRKGLRIDGNKAVTLDYGQMILRIAYGLEGLQPPHGDLYAIGEFIEYRDGLKRLISSMLFTTKPLKRKPKGTKELLPPKVHISRLCGSITWHHRAIAHLFNKGVGHHLMFKESEVLIAVLRELRAIGIVALPIHDAVIVAEDHVSVSKQVMSSVFYKMLGVEAVIREE